MSARGEAEAADALAKQIAASIAQLHLVDEIRTDDDEFREAEAAAVAEKAAAGRGGAAAAAAAEPGASRTFGAMITVRSFCAGKAVARNSRLISAVERAALLSRNDAKARRARRRWRATIRSVRSACGCIAAKHLATWSRSSRSTTTRT